MGWCSRCSCTFSPLPPSFFLSLSLAVPFYLFLVDLRLHFCCTGTGAFALCNCTRCILMPFESSLPRRGKTMGICRGLNSTISRFIAVWCARGFFWVLLKNLGIHFALPCNRRRRRGRERVTCRFSWDSNVCCLESLIPTVGSHLKLTICFRYSVWNCTLT